MIVIEVIIFRRTCFDGQIHVFTVYERRATMGITLAAFKNLSHLQTYIENEFNPEIEENAEIEQDND